MARHAKTDSDVTSLAPSSPPRSPRRPSYYVLSPAASHPDVLASGGGIGAAGATAEKMSLAGSTPAESPLHYGFHHHHHSGGAAATHHSRESSTGRLLFSDQLRSGGPAGAVPWRRLGHGSGAGSVGDDDDEEDGGRAGSPSPWRCYALAALAFVAVFAFFLLVLWGASKSYKPHVEVKVSCHCSLTCLQFPTHRRHSPECTFVLARVHISVLSTWIYNRTYSMFFLNQTAMWF
jgi:hypothetical protein